MELGTPLKASVGADAFLFYAQARIWKFAADATCGASGEDALTYLILYVYNNMNCQKVQDLF